MVVRSRACGEQKSQAQWSSAASLLPPALPRCHPQIPQELPQLHPQSCPSLSAWAEELSSSLSPQRVDILPYLSGDRSLQECGEVKARGLRGGWGPKLGSGHGVHCGQTNSKVSLDILGAVVALGSPPSIY